MQKFKLNNGLTVVHEKRQTDSVAIEINVGTGSNNEDSSIAGMSHFLEHMVFEGTKTRTAKQISEAIENVGGELNAATTNERTFFYIKVPKKKLGLAMEILADMMQNPAFDQTVLDKERKVVLEEIKMVNDQPILYQWVLFEKTIFKRHPAKNPVYGSVQAVRAITRKDMHDYYGRWYIPNNMILTVVGDFSDLPALVKKHFGNMKRGPLTALKRPTEPQETKPTVKQEHKEVNQAYIVLGYKTIPKLHKDSVVLDVISSVFSKGLSGRINSEIRVKRGLAYAVGTVHESNKEYGLFVFYLNCAKKNMDICRKIILDEIDKLDDLGPKELGEAKEHMIGSRLLRKEDSHRRGDNLAEWEFIKDARLADDYLRQVKRVSKSDIKRVRNKFLTKNYTMVVLSK
ncbi:MAG: pitrilysin family protein [Candidatus Woesearchaeota archaeon]